MGFDKSLQTCRFFEGADEFNQRWYVFLAKEKESRINEIRCLEEKVGFIAKIRRIIFLKDLKNLLNETCRQLEVLDKVNPLIEEAHQNMKKNAWQGTCRLMEKICIELDQGQNFFHVNHEGHASYEIFFGKALDFRDFLKEKLTFARIVENAA